MKIILAILMLNIFTFSQEIKWEKVATDLNFPEGIVWNYSNTLYVSSCYGGFISKIKNDSSSILISSVDSSSKIKKSNGLAVGKDGFIYACDYGIGAILKISQKGISEIYCSGYKGTKFNRPNDIAFDKKGNIYFTDPKSYSDTLPDGRVFRIDRKTKAISLVAESICFANGIAFSPDGNYLFVCESAKSQILKFKVLKDGSLGKRHIFVKLPGGDPDGIGFDIKGNLYAAHFGGGNIYIIAPDGKILEALKTPGKKPSNLEFAGSDLKTLYITDDETNSVYRTKVEVPGFKLFYSPD